MEDLYEVTDARSQRPVPLQDRARELIEGYRGHPIDRNSLVFGEPLIDVRELGLLGANHYWLARNPPVPGAIEGLFLRETVARKLKGIDDCLRLHGLGLSAKDAFRPLSVQEHIFRRTPMLVANPEGGEDSPPPHMTGAAVDVVIVRLDDSQEINMGKNSRVGNNFPDFFENTDLCGRGYPSALEQEAQGNRRLLVWLMTGSDFVVHPREWWHFSWGDQMWAVLTGKRAAMYGVATLPT